MKIDKQITLVDFSVVADGYGGTTETEVNRITLWAKVEPMSGSRGIESSQISLDQMYKIWFRYEDFPPLNKKIKIIFENRTLVIHSFRILHERRKYFELVAYEDAGADVIIYDENYQPITDENGNYITNENA